MVIGGVASSTLLTLVVIPTMITSTQNIDDLVEGLCGDLHHVALARVDFADGDRVLDADMIAAE